MSVTTTSPALSARQRSQMPSLLEFHSPSAAIIEEGVRGPARGVIWCVIALVAGCGTAAALVPIDKVVSAQGRVVATDSTIVLQPLETAIVRQITVHEGEVVHKGDLLARLDPTFSNSDQNSMTLQVESLAAEVDRLRAEAAGINYTPAALNPASLVQQTIFLQRQQQQMLKKEGYRQKTTALEGQLAKSAGDIRSYTERAQLAGVVEDKRRELEKLGWGSQLNSLQAKDQALEMRRSLDNAQQTIRSAAGDLAAMRAEAAVDDRDWQAKISQDLTEAARKLIDATANSEKANLRSKMVELRAPEDATVLTQAPVSVGSVMQSGEKFLTLVPLNAPLELEAALPGGEAGYVHLGDPVHVKFDTFPFTQYGGGEGDVRSVSPDSFTNQTDDRTRAGVVNTAGAQTGSSYFRMNVNLTKVTLHDTPKLFHVSPGMPVTLDVMVGKRTVLSYILSRALPIAMDGMREP